MNGYSSTPASWAASRMAEGSLRAIRSTSGNVALDPVGKLCIDSAVPAADQTLLILGASGDLTARLLLPGLAGLLASGGVRDSRLTLIGSGAEDWDDERWRKC